MQAADAETISTIGIGGFTLMEVAGRAVANAVLDRMAGLETPRVTCFCGTGNNGGDGFVASRILLDRGVAVRVLVAGDLERITGDACSHLDILKRVAINTDTFCLDQLVDDSGNIRSVVESSAPFKVSESDVIVDALIGTGLINQVRGRIALCVSRINHAKRPTVAIDIPSGLSGSTGRILGSAVRAQQTIVMGALKTGLLVEDGPLCTGIVTVAEIGIPNAILRSKQATGGTARLMTAAYERTRSVKRNARSYKYTSGPTFVFAGSTEFTGAPVLASIAAARSGSGYVQCICPPSIKAILSEKLTEIPVTTWKNRPDLDRSETDRSGETQAEATEIREAIPDGKATIASIGERFLKGRAYLIGPGLGRSTDSTKYVLSLLEIISQAPNNHAVIDADGLFALSGQRDRIKSWSRGQWVLTPHAGEVRFLTEDTDTGTGGSGEGSTSHNEGGAGDDTKSDPEAPGVVDTALKLAREWNCVVLLKGFPTVTAAPDGRVMINNSTLAAAATAGTGDVLAGFIAGLYAQGLDAFDASVCAIYRSSKLAEQYASLHSAESMMASDLLTLFTEGTK